MCGLMNGANSDNAVSIQKMVTPNMVGRNLVTPNMVAWNLVTPNMVGRNLDTLNVVTPKLLGTLLHRHGCVQHW